MRIATVGLLPAILLKRLMAHDHRNALVKTIHVNKNTEEKNVERYHPNIQHHVNAASYPHDCRDAAGNLWNDHDHKTAPPNKRPEQPRSCGDPMAAQSAPAFNDQRDQHCPEDPLKNHRQELELTQ